MESTPQIDAQLCHFAAAIQRGIPVGYSPLKEEISSAKRSTQGSAVGLDEGLHLQSTVLARTGLGYLAHYRCLMSLIKLISSLHYSSPTSYQSLSKFISANMVISGPLAFQS